MRTATTHFMSHYSLILLAATATTTRQLSFASAFTTTAQRHQQQLLKHSTTSILRMSSTNTNTNIPSYSSLSNPPMIPLRNGMQHPAIGFGTYKVGFIPASASSAAAAAATATTTTEQQRTAKDCVADALRIGYRFLECAEFYGNEAEVGKAIAESGIPREELFLCSKVWTTTIEQGERAIRKQLDKTLSDLQTDYLDLYLIHWPVPGHHVAAYKTLQTLQEETGKIRGIGVSNYAWEDYVELKQDQSITQLPLVNQIEINPFLYRKHTIQKFQDDGVVLQSYRSLRDGKAMDHPALQAMALKYNKSPAQILGRWCVQKGFVYVPKSVQKQRMEENANVFDVALSQDDMLELDALTTPENIRTFRDLYRKCVNRDTSKDGTLDGVKMDITED